ncbi:hypothetical protein CEXT_473871 [Caerostris extrusa]|uniref:Uncharacterized protein n=1 Tax=Caerostris extrusa TaxID=172846 RepID=A0AAV4UMQ4_CAEEX|nr:hypothetical protein CEXT_473871 [Caerostris extrusa]
MKLVLLSVRGGMERSIGKLMHILTSGRIVRGSSPYAKLPRLTSINYNLREHTEIQTRKHAEKDLQNEIYELHFIHHFWFGRY